MKHEAARSSSLLRRKATQLLIGAVAVATAVGMFEYMPSAIAQGIHSEDVSPVVSPSASSSTSPSPSSLDEDVETDPTAEPAPTQAPTPEQQAPSESNTPEEPTPSEAPQEPAPTEAPVETPLQSEAPSDGARNAPESLDVAPLALGPDGASPPYVFWDTRDESGTLRGGATYQLQGPRTNDTFLGNVFTVTDCTSAPCSGPDLDPDPGEYLVTHIGSHRISDSNRYRVRQTTPPSTYTFAETNNPWREIPGSRSTPIGWSSRTYDFGDFRVRAIPPAAPTCSAGWVYGVSDSGQIRQVAPNGTVTNLGSSAGVSYFNGLGISAGGQTVYAIERSSSSGTNQNATVWTYNTTTGTWASTGYSTSALGGDTGTNMVGGAVNLNTGLYYFGGFTSNGNFKIYEYNPSANPRIRLKGTVVTDSTSSANGDFAFNSNGDLFVVRGSGSTTTIFSVTAANFAAANGGNIPSAQATSKQTMQDVNGVAFDASGRGYLGSGSALRSYSMPGWDNQINIVNSGLNSTDLATCSSPATITIEKQVQGARVNVTDQFTLTLRQGTTTLGTATTTGNQSGIQNERIGPLPTVRGVTLTFSEAASGMPNLNNYASSWSCTVDGEPIQGASGTGTSGTVTIPAIGDAILCRITNAPLVADVTVSKTLLDENGENPQPGQNWTVGASANATTGTVTQAPTATTQQTNAQGDASWTLRFGNTSGRATIQVSEVQQDNYEFVEAECLVTPINGNSRVIALTSEASQAITNIAPGDSVQCVYVNQLQAEPQLTLVKELQNPSAGSGYADADDWTLTATGNSDTVSGVTGTPAVTEQSVAPGTYNLTEAFSGTPAGMGSGYDWTGLVCVDADQNSVSPNVTVSGGIVTAASVTLERNTQVTCTFTNTPRLGNVTWDKVDDSAQPIILAGSEWLLTGPAGFADMTLTEDTCTGAPANGPHCTVTDTGRFTVGNLPWGEYQLEETRAPAGYYPHNGVISFTIGVDGSEFGLDIELDPVVNTRMEGPELPFTGGLSRDAFFIIGVSILLLGFVAAIVLQIRRRRKEVA